MALLVIEDSPVGVNFLDLVRADSSCGVDRKRSSRDVISRRGDLLAPGKTASNGRNVCWLGDFFKNPDEGEAEVCAAKEQANAFFGHQHPDNTSLEYKFWALLKVDQGFSTDTILLIPPLLL